MAERSGVIYFLLCGISCTRVSAAINNFVLSSGWQPQIIYRSCLEIRVRADARMIAGEMNILFHAHPYSDIAQLLRSVKT